MVCNHTLHKVIWCGLITTIQHYENDTCDYKAQPFVCRNICVRGGWRYWRRGFDMCWQIPLHPHAKSNVGCKNMEGGKTSICMEKHLRDAKMWELRDVSV